MQQNHTLKTASTEMHSATTSITFFKLLHSVASGMVRAVWNYEECTCHV